MTEERKPMESPKWTGLASRKMRSLPSVTVTWTWCGWLRASSTGTVTWLAPTFHTRERPVKSRVVV